MKKIFKLSLSIFLLAFLLMAFQAKALPPEKLGVPMPKKVQLKLKKYMGALGTLFASVEIGSLDEKVDWDSLGLVFEEMQVTLNQIRAIKDFKAYDKFFGQLEKDLAKVQALQKKKSRKVFEAFDNLSTTCFRCHALYRPKNFLTEPEGQKSTRLFKP